MKKKTFLTLGWEEVQLFFKKNFGFEKIQLESVLFLIGVNELGILGRKFSKQEKMDIFHIGACEVLSRFGFYEKEPPDSDGWPKYRLIKRLPCLGVNEQENLLKWGVIEYFLERGLINCDNRRICKSGLYSEYP